MPYFSVIIPTYNNADRLPEAVNSILNQDFEGWELIIIDDGSEDNTEEILTPFLADNRIIYYKQVNKGVTSARNAGAKRASGDYITFLDSDDKVTSNWLSDFFELSESSDSSGYLSCGYYRNGNRSYPKTVPGISDFKYSSLAGSFAIKREVFENIGGYDATLKQSENWEMTARAVEYCNNKGLSILYVDNANFYYDNFPTSQETKLRDLYRAEATRHLYDKYKDEGVLHFRKDEFLISSAVNYARAGKVNDSRKMFYKNLKVNPSLQNLYRIVVFEIPYLRNKKWLRKNTK
jgi:glycosyltransferase involved in cell wall biosynthesis